ncbi:c6 transcription factor [Ophiostoma piceae UAMH 11346]|uniref:C6 transcription factor n=1 Tax=Ophiostoma piceae (strain UAMH 11346) TaxID=1262450 RepID=S3CR14_OPHP1|nr:c6 transcription factor [Ophiostoma piceae UAMH 11346]
MTTPIDSDDGNEHTPLLENNGNGASKISHSIATKLTGILPWSGSSGRHSNHEGATPEVSNEPHFPKAPSQQSIEHTSPTNESSIPLVAAARSSDTHASSSEPEQAEPGHTDNIHHRGIEVTPSWGNPAGLEPRKATDQNVLLFRQAIGINITNPDADAADPEAASMEQNRKLATGIYGRILRERRTKTLQYNVLSTFVNTCHVVQILIGASLTALGPEAATHTTAITALGATNTILAGVFALLKGQGLPDRLHKDAIEYRRVQDWIEETDSLLLSGVVGRDRKEVGLLVETAFKKYNAVLASEENNKPESYVQQQPEATRAAVNTATNGAVNLSSSHSTVERVAASARAGPVHSVDTIDDDYIRDGNAAVRLDLPAFH